MLFILENAIEYFELYCKEIEKDGVVVTDKDYFNILKYRIRHNNFYASISDDEAESLLNIIDSMCKALLENGPPFSEDEMHLFKCAERFVIKMEEEFLEALLKGNVAR